MEMVEICLFKYVYRVLNRTSTHYDFVGLVLLRPFQLYPDHRRLSHFSWTGLDTTMQLPA